VFSLTLESKEIAMPNSPPLPYFVGAQSLHDLANRRSRVCVMNILGTESAQVTPLSHAFSGGNVVAGVQYGSTGEVLETPVGPVPVYGSVAEVLKNGHSFDTGVIYLPPSAVSHAVSELCVRNKELERIFILSEKVSVRDSRLIRYVAQNRRVDVIGANSLGIANAWDRVRIGGALGGDDPAGCLKKGSIAIYSNSGNFCTTLAEYLKTRGFGTSTIFSSGKDFYIHFALAEFLYCAENDPRTKAVLVYIEPGGYYEKQALDWIREGRLPFSKPLVACVTGRWKSSLSRPCGHAGAMGGGSDDAFAKEGWFDDYFRVPPFSATHPQVGPKGVRVTTIQDLPAAVEAVMAGLGEAPDFLPKGDLSLKAWLLNHQGHHLPESLRLKPVTPLAPYDRQLAEANRLVGACLVRESMRNASSATRIDAASQQTELYGKPVLDLIDRPFAATCLFALLRQQVPDTSIPLANALLNGLTRLAEERPAPVAAQGRANGCTPNAYLAAELLLAGHNRRFQNLVAIGDTLLDAFFHQTGAEAEPDEAILKKVLESIGPLPKGEASPQDRAWAEDCADLLKKLKVETILTRFAERYSAREQDASAQTNPMDLLAAAVLLGWAWPALKSRRIPRQTAVELGIHLSMMGLVTSAGSVARLWPEGGQIDFARDFVDTLFRSLFGRPPADSELFVLNALLNLTVSNGPGTLSVMGAKESVSAGNYLPTAYAGFMTNTGLAHGGNGFKAVAWLLGVFEGHDPYRTPQAERDVFLRQLAEEKARDFLAIKKNARGAQPAEPIPCINHPVFRGQAVNIDPREERLRALLRERGIQNPFLEFYHQLVEQLYAVGATRNVFCVNVDAVIATLALELFWPQWQNGGITLDAMQDAVFRLFLYGRMPGIAAEIADHRSRGSDMDCRTPNEELRYMT
jgi:succinyl-CoA synthetase alpha subunit/citrate synthase